ncbi:MAG: bifunctional riboflavin kinase/FAD synthetase, partial [Hydrotalea flava]|nr:bifunctional riboflavin kinase/FAD synthetase [Hydrotalea flava]NIN14976.1 bifunctional riboflavin kinase/FAD synthetase [Hydrotalea flava]NIO94044.1 bifunctional riboflavin kinase/FAD synthetase [Hydrotalea flava]NIS92882.1 bifunctional riboflavin kinase/FAD synthetase [Hydrotalea flava]NIT19416.1 bifunctional riboflavin kinase/FAD synthetase [Hydrotalea flava]
MKLFCSIDAIKSQLHGCVASIGNYDGMHLGHQKILKRVCSRAATMNLPSLLIIFEPLPMEYFL